MDNFLEILKKAKRNAIMVSLALFVIIVVIIFFYIRKKRKIVRIAKKHVGQLELTAGSYEKGFKSQSFEKKMRENGFSEGYDWCAIFAKSVVTDSLKGKKKEIVKNLMNPSSQRTYNNLVDASKQYRWIKLHSKPVAGAIVTWQKVENPAFGHVGIVKSSKGNSFQTIEGNASTGTGFDGVAEKNRNLDERLKSSGLRLRKYFIKIN